MTFPTIPTAAAGRILSVFQTTNSTTKTFPDLSSLTKNSGDLLVAIAVVYDGTTPADTEFSGWGGGFTEFQDQVGSSSMAVGCAYKWSTGSETGTFTVTTRDTTAAIDSVLILLSIPGAHGTSPPEAGPAVYGTTVAADPASFDPTGWGAEDTLWIAVAGSGETGTGANFTGVASGPANYTDFWASGISEDVIGGVEAGLAFRQLNAASEDVGAFSVDLSNARNMALLVAVRPVAATNAQAGSASGTGTADNPSASVVVSVELATGTGTAENPTVSTGGGATNAQAESASGTGTADNPSPSIKASAGTAAAAGVAENPTISTGGAATNAPAELASGTGTADNASVAIGATAGSASATGVGNDTTATVKTTPTTATGIGTANNPTVLTGTVVNPGLATGTGTANNSNPKIAPVVGTATGTGTANNATAGASVTANAGLASGTGIANNPTLNLGRSAMAEIATGTGTAYDTGAAVAVLAEAAAVVAAAFNASIPAPYIAARVDVDSTTYSGTLEAATILVGQPS